MSIKNYTTACLQNKEKEKSKLINLEPMTKKLIPWEELEEEEKKITIKLFPEMRDNFGKPITVYFAEHVEWLGIDTYRDEAGYIYYPHWFEKD